MDNVNFLWFPYRLPRQVAGLKALYERVIIHREINYHETRKVFSK